MQLINFLKGKSAFRGNVITMMTGTIIAQAIPVAISPILTRIFTPDEFGVLAIYMGIAGFLAIFATLRYEHALVLTSSKTEVDNLLIVSFFLTILISLLLLFIVVVFKEEFASTFELDEVGMWIYTIPLSVFLLGLYNSLNSRLVWLKNFKSSASNRVVLSGTNAFCGISAGALGFTQVGLIFANLVSYQISVFYLLRKNQVTPIKISRVTQKRMRLMLYKYRDFPSKNLPSAVVNGLYNNGKLVFIAVFYSSTLVGLLSLVLRVMQMPVTLVSSSISDVLYKSSAESINQSSLSIIRSKVYKLLIILSLIGIIPFGTIFVYGELIFAFVFGVNWDVAGEYASILSIGLFAMFVASPLTKVFWALKKNALYLYWELLRLLLVLIPIAYIGYTGIDEQYIVWSLSFSLVISYLAMIIMLHSVLKDSEN